MKILLIVLILFGSLLLPKSAFAALYINEFSSSSSPEWVEIYNSDSSSVDLSNYVIRDSTDSHKIDLSGNISGNGFATFEFGGSTLNNDGDKIRLFVKNEGGNESSVNEVVYGTPGDVRAPESGQSAGRNSDGTSNWVIFSNTTRGGTNNSASVVYTPTPTNSPTPAPTSAPTSTKTPTPAPTSTPTKAPSSTPTKIMSPTATNIPSPTDDPNSDLKVADSNNQNVFGNSGDSSSNSEGEVLGISTSSTPFMFIVLGLIILAVCGILVYLQFGDKILLRFKKKSE